MNYSVNPFQELYVADTPSLEHFVKLFSKVPMKSLSLLQPLFQSSNVVLVGTQGCGKTMLLNLLRPDIRKAYFDFGESFPVEGDAATFLSAGVNLTKSALPQIAEVTLGSGQELDLKELPYYFGDFFNYSVIDDLLENLIDMTKRPDVFGNFFQAQCFQAFVLSVVKEDCWFNALDGVGSMEGLQSRIKQRLAWYRKWVSLNLKDKSPPQTIRETKTAIGEPILRLVKCLKASDVISERMPVFIRIDQIESLHQQQEGHKAELLLAFRQILNAAVGKRDTRVSYRLGSRKWGWNAPDALLVHGTGGRLEERRDYIQIDLDDALRRKEYVRSGFEAFAADAFLRRVRYYLETTEPLNEKLVRCVFGRSPNQRKRADYFGKSRTGFSPAEKVLGFDDNDTGKWTTEWRKFLLNIYERDPLEAVLAAAWGRQKGSPFKKEHRNEPPPTKSPYPWERVWWRKERLALGTLQLAARRQQRMLWWGCDDIFALSGGNISCFIHICHEVWDQFLKDERTRPENQRSNPLKGETIDKITQAVGIQNASAIWYRKLAEQPGGDVRRRFIERLGNFLRKKLREDKSMSHPGGNGFSLASSDLEAQKSPNKEIWHFLREAVGFGDLTSAPHTTKEKSGRHRLKFYLSPILSPAFQIPVAHTKEPLYWKVEDILRIAKEAELPFTFTPSLKVKTNNARKNDQLDLL